MDLSFVKTVNNTQELRGITRRLNAPERSLACHFNM